MTRLLYAEQIVGEIGKQLAMIALPVIAVQFLHAGVGQVACISLLNAVSAMLGSMLLGRLSYRLASRRIPVGGSFLWAVGLGTICLLGILGVLSLATFAVLYAALNACGSYYRMGVVGVVRTIVDDDQRMVLNARLNLYQSVVSVGMPTAAGALVSIVSPYWVLGLTASACLFSGFVFKLLLPGSGTNERERAATTSSQITSPLTAGLKHGKPRTPPAAWLGVAIEGVLAFDRAFILTVLPVLALTFFGLGSEGLGLIFTVGGLGFLGGALVGRFTARVFSLANASRLSAAMAVLAGAGLFVPTVIGHAHLIGLSAFAAFSAAASLQFDLAVSSWRQSALTAEALSAVTGFADSSATAARLLASVAAGAVGTSLGGVGICVVGACMAFTSAVALLAVSATMREGRAA
ncbi:MFS transporter [Austwickia sp. TVS 96-490-7B]|uniref:MFS transporter n=1 Tax=Austwickia sp. TVS 96-490-7B TaxID=2830843 RepID=UPI001C57918D|nr:MFS transporter [Austwickia sp. TVS 96-490-7B]